MKVNLEKELLAQNKMLITPQALLEIREYEKHEELSEDDSLSRIGITQSLNAGKLQKTKMDNLKKDTLRFDQSRVFHISQIKSICLKYALRFLPSCLYKGTLDKDLPYKINNFEAIYGVKLESHRDKYERDVFSGNTFIIAPEESFNLTQDPQDPLMFYQINEEYYFLIHKWGNDLSYLRTLKSDLGKSFIWCSGYILSVIISYFILHVVAFPLPIVIFFTIWIPIILFVILVFCCDPKFFYNYDHWNSPYF